jgi:hypothetical protein
MTTYDTSGRFRTLIRHKTALFYDENSALNTWALRNIFSIMAMLANTPVLNTSPFFLIRLPAAKESPKSKTSRFAPLHN